MAKFNLRSLLLAAASGSVPAAGQLNSLAKAAGLLYFGTAVDNPSLTNTAYTAVAFNLSEFGQITPANGQKWDSIEPSNGVYSYTQGDAVTSKAQSAGQILRCHNLVWYNQLPSWVSSGSWTTTTLESVLTSHITNEVLHYKGQCYAWDVVNEALSDTGTYRADVFYNILGTGYIPFAFKAAAAADPAAKLYYNDYNIEYAGAKLTAAVSIVKNIQSSGGRIDGVGLQGHFIVGSTPSKASLVAALQTFTALGVEVAYTELDVRHSSVPASAAAQQQQAADYVTVVSACLAVAKCVGVTVWDFDDQYSWVPSTFSGSGEADLWSSNLVKKPAYTSIASFLKSAATAPVAVPTVVTTTPVITTAPATTAAGSNSHYAQCGGIGFTGAAGCASPYTCSTLNSYYAQCL
ncbi:putative endo-1,4-beta-xylanase [Coniella lustricola]|uniref:Beta-xylanase n=1 Tax=Coniella lustricola TaxID=2025994 RepID=A0A2T3AHE2_9PEZI|nr:putative endo-1,4-beta-xylanase [Coniella lustricola]